MVDKCLLKIKQLIKITGIVLTLTILTIIVAEFVTSEYGLFIVKTLFFFEVLTIVITAIVIFRKFFIIEKLNLDTRD